MNKIFMTRLVYLMMYIAVASVLNGCIVRPMWSKHHHENNNEMRIKTMLISNGIKYNDLPTTDMITMVMRRTLDIDYEKYGYGFIDRNKIDGKNINYDVGDDVLRIYYNQISDNADITYIIYMDLNKFKIKYLNDGMIERKISVFTSSVGSENDIRIGLSIFPPGDDYGDYNECFGMDLICRIKEKIPIDFNSKKLFLEYISNFKKCFIQKSQ